MSNIKVKNYFSTVQSNLSFWFYTWQVCWCKQKKPQQQHIHNSSCQFLKHSKLNIVDANKRLEMFLVWRGFLTKKTRKSSAMYCILHKKSQKCDLSLKGQTKEMMFRWNTRQKTTYESLSMFLSVGMREEWYFLKLELLSN